DRPISDAEDDVLKVIKKYAGGNPYASISYNSISEADWKKITPALITSIIEEYLSKAPVDYIRLRWLYRRLAQIGHPGALEVSLNRIDDLGPCIASICQYVSSIQEMSAADWLATGSRLLGLLDREEVRDNEYFRLSILSLF